MAVAIIVSIVAAIIFAAVLQFAFRRRGPGPGGGLLFLFVIIFLFSWVGGGRITPFGPQYDGISWLAYAAVAFFIMLLLAAILPAAPRNTETRQTTGMTTNEVKNELEAQTVISVTFGIFFWILIVSLLILGVASVFYSGEPVVPVSP